MLCTPNTSKQQLLNSKDNFTTVVFDLQKDTNKKSNNSNKQFSFKKLLNEFEKNNDFTLNFFSTTISSKTYYFYNSNSGALHKATIEQPPDGCSCLLSV